MSKNKNLGKLQQNFSDHIFNRRKVSILSSFSYSSQESLARLNIYRNNVFGNFSSVLSSIFEVTKKILGEEKFDELVEKYCVKFSSKSGNLDDYGSEFPQFLKKIKPAFLKTCSKFRCDEADGAVFREPQLGVLKHTLSKETQKNCVRRPSQLEDFGQVLSDLARLEWFYHQSYFSAEAGNFDVEKFKKIVPENFQNLCFELHPSCFLLRSKFAIFSLWKNETEDNSKKKVAVNRPEFVLVERGLEKSMMHKLSLVEFIFLSNLHQKKTLYQTYQKICRLTKKHCDIGKLLSKFIDLGIIINFKMELK